MKLEILGNWEKAERAGIKCWLYNPPLYHGRWTTPAEIISLYQERQLSMLSELDGAFAIVLETLGKVVVIVDRYGICSPFYTIDSDSIAVSPDIQLLGKKKLNEGYVLEYLSCGFGTTAFTLGAKTLFRDVFRFEPASVTTINSNIATACYWNPFLSPKGTSLTREEMCEQFNSIVKEATINCGVLLPITGGKDTRTILSSLLVAHNKPSCFTYGHSIQDADIALAKKICQHYELSHNPYMAMPLEGFVQSAVYKSASPSPPVISYMGIISSLAQEKMQNRRVLASGICGNELWRNRFADLVNLEAIWHEPSETLYRTLCSKQPQVYLQDADSILKASFAEATKSAPFHILEDNTILSDWFIWRNMIPNWAGMLMQPFARDFKLFVPMLNKRLAEVIYQRPLGERTSGVVQKYIIATNQQYLTSLPYDTDLEAPMLSSPLAKKARMLLRNSIGSFLIAQKTKLFPKPWFTSASKPSTWSEASRDGYSELRDNLLDYDSMATRHLFDREKLEAFVKSDIKPPWVERLMSLELWLRK